MSHVSPAATVRDGRRVPPVPGQRRRGEHPGARVSVAETPIAGYASNRGSPRVTSGTHGE